MTASTTMKTLQEVVQRIGSSEDEDRFEMRRSPLSSPLSGTEVIEVVKQRHLYSVPSEGGSTSSKSQQVQSSIEFQTLSPLLLKLDENTPQSVEAQAAISWHAGLLECLSKEGREKSLQKVYKEINRFLREGKAERVDFVLSRVADDVGLLTSYPIIAISFLTITLSAKRTLLKRAYLGAKVSALLQHTRGDDEAKKILHGLL